MYLYFVMIRFVFIFVFVFGTDEFCILQCRYVFVIWYCKNCIYYSIYMYFLVVILHLGQYVHICIFVFMNKYICSF